MSELRTLGRYRILRRLGRGGMANVYLAELSGDHGFAKTVAIKTIHPHRAGEARFVTMFLEEMRVASRLSHPNVCAVLDFGMEGETPYLVMEHLDGFPLSAVVAHDSVGIPRDIAARVVADAARGLHAAHELPGRDGKPGGIVHRDVSPQNVMLLRTGVAKVLDFGIAKAADPSGAITSSHPKGKLRYMAPEQLAGAPVDRRADIWSLGVVLWEATLGRRLFAEGPTGGASASVMSQRIERPSSIDPTYPAALEDVVMATLKRSPERRLPTAGHVADALEAFLYAQGKPCGAAQVSAWLATRATTMLATEPTRSASHPEPAIARPTSPEPETRPIPLVPDGCATETASLPPQRHPVAFAGPSSETRPLGPGILGESVAELSTVILAPPESATPTPGPGGAPTTSSARAPRPARRELRLAVVAAVVSAMAIGAWVGTRRRSGATEATRSAIPRQMDPIPPIGGATRGASAPPSTAASAARSTPPTALGAPTRLDATGVPDGSAEPTTPLPVDRRRRAATGAAPGATPPRRGTTPEVARTAGLGAISVNADPPADIFIDGRPFGRTPFHARPIAAGRHQMVARSIDGALTRRVVIHVPDDGHVRINPFRDAHR